jgi:predicted transcriptional regulator
MMKCEIMAKSMPGIRALIAKELASQGKTQEDIAKMLGVSQGAVSQYANKLRGNKISAESLQVKEICRRLLEEKADLEKEICGLCCQKKSI